ncbi:MAG: hypothetical protein AABX38_00225 [Candidatus Micrarchaeota archaeon]
MKLLMSFGKHQNALDASELRADLVRFKPHVYVKETILLTPDRRLPIIAFQNKRIKDGRKSPEEKKSQMHDIAKAFREEDWVEFKVEEYSIVADSQVRWMHNVEDYPQEQIQRMAAAGLCHTRMGGIILSFVSRGDFGYAMGLAEQELRGFKLLVKDRNKRIVRGIMEMEKELPNLALDEELRVLCRFGLTHKEISVQLKEKLGESVELVRYPKVNRYVELLSDPNPGISKDDLVYYMFYCLYNDFVDTQFGVDFEKSVRIEEEVFRQLGGSAGFLERMEKALNLGMEGGGVDLRVVQNKFIENLKEVYEKTLNG